MSDLHSGYDQGGKDGAEWFESACKDMSEAGFQIDYAMTLGDITHGGSEVELQRYIEIRAKSGIATWHEIAGNHEHHTPYSKGHIARVKDTTYINVASMSHAYKTGSSESYLLEFKTGAKEIVARRRRHDSKEFVPEFEVIIPLRHELMPGAV